VAGAGLVDGDDVPDLIVGTSHGGYVRVFSGATGALLAGVGAIAIATGSALMAHDWKDRPLWFVRGWQDQP